MTAIRLYGLVDGAQAGVDISLADRDLRAGLR
jgi:hypothetical protein